MTPSRYAAGGDGRWERAILFSLLVLLLFCPVLTGQTLVQDRQYEHVLLSAHLFAEFSGGRAPVDELFVYVYRGGTWEQIPFQIDERDGSGSYFGADDGMLDDNDQVTFMARDAGEMAPGNDWVPDFSARSYPRYEIRLSDPLTTNRGFVYLYRSATLTLDPLVTPYVSYSPGPTGQPAADTVRGVSYVQGHTSNGIPDYLVAPGATGADFLDRLKLRIRGNPQFIGETVVNERDNLTAISVKAVHGPVRVIREVLEKVTVTFLGTEIEVTQIGIMLFFYPYSEQLSGTINLTTDLKANLLRLTFDFNSGVQNASWYNQHTGPLTITGNSGGLTNPAFGVLTFLPQQNWFTMISNHGSLTGIFGMDSLANTNQAFYYWDTQGSPADGTNDTGDGVSFGESGFWITSGSNIVASFNLGMSAYITGANWTNTQAAALATNIETPLQVNTNLQDFDMRRPLAVDDLQIGSSTATSVTLQWTAPADDDSISAVASYELGFSTTAVGNDTANWFDNIAQKATGLPTPAAPGTPESATVAGLATGARYFFVLRSVDDFGNLSPFSNIAVIDAVPVELASFTVEVARNQAALHWTTASETNNLGFYVERQREGEDTWRELGFVRGNGTTTQPHFYSYTDDGLQPGSYSYRLRQVDFDGSFEYSQQIQASVMIPQRFVLLQNYPNPLSAANAGTIIRYEIPNPEPAAVELRIFNLLGREVRLLVNEDQPGGYYEIKWDGRLANGERAPAGIYFYELRTVGLRQIKKMTLVR